MSKQQYLLAVLEIIQGSPQSQTGLRASTLGNLTLRKLPHLHWNLFGWPALKDLLLDLQSQGRVRLIHDAKQMLAVTIDPLPIAAATAAAAAIRPASMRLRRDIWAAFINLRPVGMRYLNR